jgi:hypothetical protein
MRVVIPPRGLGAQYTEPVILLDDPPAGVVDAQRGGGSGAQAEAGPLLSLPLSLSRSSASAGKVQQATPTPE